MVDQLTSVGGVRATVLKFPSDFPKDCPPNDAITPDGVYYRITRRDPPTSDDFLSTLLKDRRLAEKRIGDGKYTLCETMGISVFGDFQHVLQYAMQFPMLGDFIATVHIHPSHGRIKATGLGHMSHHTWWLSASCQPLRLVADTQIVRRV